MRKLCATKTEVQMSVDQTRRDDAILKLHEFVIHTRCRGHLFECAGRKYFTVRDREGLHPGVVCDVGPTRPGICRRVFRHKRLSPLCSGAHIPEVPVYAKRAPHVVRLAKALDGSTRLECGDLWQGDLLEAFDTEFQAHSGSLHATKGDAWVHGIVFVNPGGPGD